MKKTLFFLFVFVIGLSTYAQLIPAPEHLKFDKGHFILDNATGVVVKGLNEVEGDRLVNYLIDKIEGETGVRVSGEKGKIKNILFEVLKEPSKNLGDEGYLLNISSTEINIMANSYVGLFYGAQSLMQ